MPSINIKRVEQVLITNKHELLEEHDFDNWIDAFNYLERELEQELSSFHRQAFIDNPFTATNAANQMVDKGGAAYLARVLYIVEVGV